MNSKNKLAEMPIRPLLYTMAVPLMLSLLVQSLYNIVDSIFVARLSETALTAASLVYSVQFLMIAVDVGTAVGLNALLSRKISGISHDWYAVWIAEIVACIYSYCMSHKLLKTIFAHKLEVRK